MVRRDLKKKAFLTLCIFVWSLIFVTSANSIVVFASVNHAETSIQVLRVSINQTYSGIGITVNLTSQIALSQAKFYYCYEGETSPSNQSMTLLSEKTIEKHQSTLWHTLIPLPKSDNYTLVSELFITDVYGTSSWIALDKVNAYTSSSKAHHLLPPASGILLFSVLGAVVGGGILAIIFRKRAKPSKIANKSNQ